MTLLHIITPCFWSKIFFFCLHDTHLLNMIVEVLDQSCLELVY